MGNTKVFKSLIETTTGAAFRRGIETSLNFIVAELERGNDINEILISMRKTLISLEKASESLK